MHITQEADYALRIMMRMAEANVSERLRTTQMAEELCVPHRFALKILKRLCQNELLVSSRGLYGGYRLVRPPQTISLYDIISAIDGVPVINRCLADPLACNRGASGYCQAHYALASIQAVLTHELQKCTLDQLVGEDNQEAVG